MTTTNDNLPDDREAGTGTVDVERCLDILRDIVANAENNHRLERRLKDQFAPDSYLLPHECRVPAVLVESAMKALGQPYPKVPTPRKVPNLPTKTQAAALVELSKAAEGKQARLVFAEGYSYSTRSYYIETPHGLHMLNLRETTFDALKDYKWVERVSVAERRRTFYTITSNGRAALARYQAKRAKPTVDGPAAPSLVDTR